MSGTVDFPYRNFGILGKISPLIVTVSSSTALLSHLLSQRFGWLHRRRFDGTSVLHRGQHGMDVENYGPLGYYDHLWSTLWSTNAGFSTPKLAREYVALPQASCGRIRNKRPTYDELSSMDIMVNHGAPRARTHKHLPHIGVGPLGQLHHPSNSPKWFTNLAEWLQHVS